MLNKQEKDFIDYWGEQRKRKKQYFKKLSIGLPLGVAIVFAIIITTLSGWYKRADMVIRSNSSLIIVILIAAVAIVIFIIIFSVRHRWDQNEQQYQEILAREQTNAA